MWKIEISKKADQCLEKLDKQIKGRILAYIDNKVSKDPLSFGKALEADLKGLWRYRVGDYRIICQIKEKELIVLVVDVGHRSKIYK